MAATVSSGPRPSEAARPRRGADRRDAPPGPEALTVALAALVPDQGGEVVLVNEGGPGSVAVATDQRVLIRGPAGPHVTAGGVDVTGFRLVVFESGLTLYHPADLRLRIVPAGG